MSVSDGKTKSAKDDTKVLTAANTIPDKPTPDMQKYFAIREATGNPVDLSTDEGRAQAAADYNQWVSAGRPAAEMPKIVTEKVIPRKLYRIKHLGKQYFYFRDTRDVLHGQETVKTPIKARQHDDRTGKDIEWIARYRETPKYTREFNKADAEKLAKQALAECVDPTFYVKEGDRKVQVTPEQFVGDFDKVLAAPVRQQGKAAGAVES